MENIEGIRQICQYHTQPNIQYSHLYRQFKDTPINVLNENHQLLSNHKLTYSRNIFCIDGKHSNVYKLIKIEFSSNEKSPG